MLVCFSSHMYFFKVRNKDFEEGSGLKKVAQLLKDVQVEEHVEMWGVCTAAYRTCLREGKHSYSQTNEKSREQCVSVIWAASQFGSTLGSEQRQMALEIQAELSSLQSPTRKMSPICYACFAIFQDDSAKPCVLILLIAKPPVFLFLCKASLAFAVCINFFENIVRIFVSALLKMPFLALFEDHELVDSLKLKYSYVDYLIYWFLHIDGQ